MATRKVGAGIYITNGKCEVDIPEMLAHFGIPDTEGNRDMCVEVANKVFKELGIITPTTQVSHTHIHKCLMCKRKFQHEGKRKKCKLPKETFCSRCN